ncbi:hypothetical protein MYAM1_004086 [Malassezia yamatoensis]|uniref:Mitochondrial import inner membrane translocase subunit TIM50 n=1 Tax=Malassezia yamatoensis TaxID=253288 RepID=A0AAJ6CJZ7_9BASI|nr:hypothetical protein MYAM1_004086 [Malassezia yamatoensis]
MPKRFRLAGLVASQQKQQSTFVRNIATESRLNLSMEKNISPLLVLDLNGTLVYRHKDSRGRARSSMTARPYLECFLRYCLGPMYGKDAKEFVDSWPENERVQVDAQVAPYGSQYWLPVPRSCALNGKRALYEPAPTRLNVMVWSSATEANVNRMLENITHTPIQRSLFQRVWSRDSLVLPEDLGRKASTTKDLSIIWDDLNQWKVHSDGASLIESIPSTPSRVKASYRLARYHQQLLKDKQAAKNKQSTPSRARNSFRTGPEELYAESLYRLDSKNQQHGLYGNLLTEPWGPHNTLLLDDSEEKARCHPGSHLRIAEYGKQQADAFKQYASQKDANDDALDDYLLRCIGMLDAIKDVPNVTQWLDHDARRQILLPDQPKDVRQYWCERGREALLRCDIPIVP